MLNSVALIDPGPVRIQSGFSTPPPSYPIPSTLILSVGSDSPITLHHIPIQSIPYLSIAHPIAYHLNPFPLLFLLRWTSSPYIAQRSIA